MPFLPPDRIIFFCIIITATVAATVTGADNYQYLNCGRNFTCGNVSATYPFWGNGRESYCGLSSFNLFCDTGIPKIQMMAGEKLRILSFNQTGRTMSVARDDFWNTLCPPRLLSTPQVINYTTFPIRNNPSILALYYACQSMDDDDLVSVSVGCRNGSSVEAWAGMTTDPSITNDRCNTTVVIPVSGSSDIALRGITPGAAILEAVNAGFVLGWFYSDIYDVRCSECLNSGGVCGSSSGNSDGVESFNCFCSDGTNRCLPVIKGKKTNSAALIVGLAVGASVLAGALTSMAYCFLRLRQRRRRGEAGFFTPSSEDGGHATKSASSALFFRHTPNPYGKTHTSSSSSSRMGVQLFTYSDLEEATGKFEGAKELGEGGFGVVYYGKLRDGREVAVKRLFERNFKGVEQFMNEVEILTRLRHPNLVTLYGCTSRRSRELLLVYEYVPNGTVSDHLHGGKAEPTPRLTWPLRLAVAAETAGALAYLHATDIIHRDVKTNNILLDADFHVKVADFGISRLFPTDVTHVSTAPQGTPGYVDPEYYHCYHLTEKSDVYSFGVVLVELLSSKPAVDLSRKRHDINLANMALSRIQSQTLEELVDTCLGFKTDPRVREGMTAVAELAFRCLQADREMRPTMEEVVEVLDGMVGGRRGESPVSIEENIDWATTISSSEGAASGFRNEFGVNTM